MCSLPMKTTPWKWPQVVEKQNTEEEKKNKGIIFILIIVIISKLRKKKQQVKQAAALQDNHHLWTEVTELLIIALTALLPSGSVREEKW